MTVTATTFKGNFPEFTDITTYPDVSIAFWIGLATNLLDPGRWGNLLDYGIQLFVAHNLCLERDALTAARTGQNPGSVNGPLASATVDKVSYARNPGLVMDPKNGHWNLSTFGLRYVQLVRMIGAGPVYVGAPTPDDVDMSQSAWVGPWQAQFPNPSN